MTRAPLRFLIALANVRLGVWMLKPELAKEVAKGQRRRIRPPGLTYLWREAHGTTPVNAHYVYVTDGGHYDNLGLVELLKERCEWIWCIDASGDHIDTFSTLGQAVALAQAEFDIVIDIHPDEAMKPVDGSDWVKAPFCVATITYPETDTSGPTTGTLVVVKAGVPEKAPWAIEYYRNSNREFPCDSTINQLFTAEKFDAYVALGHYSMKSAFDDGAIHARWGEYVK